MGLASSRDREIMPLANGDRVEATGEETEEEAPAPEVVSVPEEDVPGADLTGLDRYPGSVRIEYLRERQGDMIWTEIEYLTDASMSEARDHYRNAFRKSGWNVNDIGFAQDSWVFFIVKDERELFVELRPRGNGVEIDLEQTEPAPVQQPQKQPQPAPEQAAPEQVAPPVYEDDEDYDYYEEDEDDGYEYDDDDYGDYDD